MSTLDLTGVNTVVFDVYASRTGSNLKFGLRNERETNGSSWTGATGTTPPTGWTSLYGSGDWSDIDTGALKLTTKSDRGAIYRAFTVVVGVSYTVSIKLKKGNQNANVSIGTSAGASQYGSLSETKSDAFYSQTFTFSATGTTAYVTLYVSGSDVNDYCYMDDCLFYAITELTPNITSANTWQTVVWDLSAVDDADKNNIDEFIITVVNADAENTFYVDNFKKTDPVPTVSEDGMDDWRRLQVMLNESVNAGSTFSQGIVSTYSLIFTDTSNGAYVGGVLAPNGDTHYIPGRAAVGQKVSPAGVVSTYSLIYTTQAAFAGGVLAPNGDIHFIPDQACVGQKVSSSGVVSTYSLAYTNGGTDNYYGGVIAPNGDIHFVPMSAPVGQKVSSSGIVSTYSLIYTDTNNYLGGVLASDGYIHFIPYSASVGQKVSSSGIVSTYSLVKTGSGYYGGVLALNGDIHFVPNGVTVGQKISVLGVVSTYSLVYNGGGAVAMYCGGVLAPNGDIHFVPWSSPVGQKVSASGVVSTYSLVYTKSNNYIGGVLAPNGDIHFVTRYAAVGQKISTNPEVPFSLGICCSPFFNKF
jgi:hypothetical protein